MATITIAGHECNFPQIPHATLKNYEPTPRTWILAWKTPEPVHQVMLTSLLHSAFAITALERPPYLVEDGQRTIYLLEYPNQAVLDNIERWLYWTCGINFYLKNPYRIAKAEDDIELNSHWDEYALTTTRKGKRPLLGKTPPSHTVKPFDSHPDYGGSAITLHETLRT